MATYSDANHKAQDAADQRWFTVAPSQLRDADSYWDFDVPTWAQSLTVIINATVEADTASVVFTIQGVDPVSGGVWDILASAAVEAISSGTETILKVSPHITAAANLVAKDILPGRIRIDANHADADDLTYSIGAAWSA